MICGIKDKVLFNFRPTQKAYEARYTKCWNSVIGRVQHSALLWSPNKTGTL